MSLKFNESMFAPLSMKPSLLQILLAIYLYKICPEFYETQMFFAAFTRLIHWFLSWIKLL
jgi:hypothetical protein